MLSAVFRGSISLKLRSNIWLVVGSLVAKSCQTVVTLWTLTHWVHLSMEFPTQGYWSGLPFPSSGDLPNPGIEPTSSALQANSLPLSHQESPIQPMRQVLLYFLFTTVGTEAPSNSHYLYYTCISFLGLP